MDTISKRARSALMAKIRSNGNRSTETQFRLALVRARIKGWRLHPCGIPGQPDFWFEKQRVAVFVDGCFWHGCPRCLRMPKDNKEYWETKIARNKARARIVERALKAQAIRVLRFWEHDLRKERKTDRLVQRIKVCLKMS